MKTVYSVIVGKDVSRTGSVSLGTPTANSTIVEGEVVVLDANGELLTAGTTIADTPYVQIAVGLGTTATFANPSTGTSYTHRNLLKSGPIFPKDVQSFLGEAYTAPTAKKVRISTFSPSTTDETVLRLVYTDERTKIMTPSHMIQDYRITAGASGLSNWARRIAAKINLDANSRVTATLGTGNTALYLEAKSAPDQTLNDIDKHFVVDFEAKVYNANSGLTGNTVPSGITNAVSTSMFPGQGTWQLVRDMEKSAHNYRGLINRTTFPIPSGFSEWMTTKDETYDAVVIKHNNVHETSDMGYRKNTNQATYIYIPNNRGNQMEDVLDKLNTYLGSAGFAPVSL